MSTRQIHMLGNSHIDLAWYWMWEEGMQEVKATFQSILQRMEEYPAFTFTCTSSAYFDWIEKIDSALFTAIKQRVLEGRWEIVGGWYVEADCILPSGESLIRQALYGQQYLRSRFGFQTRIGSNVDSFGHTNTLPMLLKGCHLDYYVCMRPPMQQSRFLWNAPDGSSVDTLHLPGEYTTWTEQATLDNIERTKSAMPGASQLPVCFGVGNHGGGPTKDNIETILKLQRKATDDTVLFSTFSTYFSSEPFTHDSVQNGAFDTINSGCWTNDNPYKLANRTAEQMLPEAEFFVLLCHAFNPASTKQNNLQSAWEKLLKNQFHDLLCGTAIKQARDEALWEIHAALAEAKQLRAFAILQCIQSIDTCNEGFPLFIFNSQGYAYEGLLEIELPWFCQDSLTIYDDQGAIIPYQRVHTRCKATHLSIGGRRNIVLKVGLPSYGFVQYRASALESHSMMSGSTPSLDGPYILDNGIIRAVIDEKSGCISSLVELETNFELLSDVIHYQIWHDERDSWGHMQDGRYSPSDEILSLDSISYIETGPLRSSVKIELRGHCIELRMVVVLEAGSDSLLIENTLVWNKKWHMLRLEIPIVNDATCTRCETSYGSLERICEPGRDYFMHRYLDTGNLLVLNTNTHAYSCDKNNISLIILRSPIYAQMRGNWSFNRSEQYDWANIGEHRYSFLLHPHKNNISTQTCLRKASQLSSKPLYILDSNHPGSHVCKSFSLASVDAEGVSLVMLKWAENGTHPIARLLETEGHDVGGHLIYRGKHYPFQIGKFELITLSIDEELCRADRVSLLEETYGPSV